MSDAWDQDERPSMGFAAVPSWMVHDTSRISKHALLAYIALSSRVNSAGECWPSIPRIAAEARCSETSAKAALKELESLGIISRRQTIRDDGGFGHNIYTVHVGIGSAQNYRTTQGQQATGGGATGDRKLYPGNQLGIRSFAQRSTPQGRFATDRQRAFLRDLMIHNSGTAPTAEDEQWLASLTPSQAWDETRALLAEVDRHAFYQGPSDGLAYEALSEAGKRGADRLMVPAPRAVSG